MKEEAAGTSAATTYAAAAKTRPSVFGSLSRGGKYKVWALAAMLLLALWSMFTGSVTLKWSAGNLTTLSGDFDSPINHDLDILEIEEREKLVRHMWDVYSQSKSSHLPKFWQEAFKAAYRDLVSEVANVRDAAVSEIAKISLLRPTILKQLQTPPLHSTFRATGATKEARLTEKPVKTRRHQRI